MKDIIIYGLQTAAGSSSVQPIPIDSDGKIAVMLYGLKTAGGSSSAFPLAINSDDELETTG